MAHVEIKNVKTGKVLHKLEYSENALPSDQHLAKKFIASLVADAANDGVSFVNAYLSNLNFSGLEIKAANFVEAKFSSCRFNSSFDDCNFAHASFENSFIEVSNFVNCIFDHSKFETVDCFESSFLECDFQRSNFKNLVFEDCLLRRVELDDCHLKGSNFGESYIIESNMRNSNLKDCNFSDSVLKDVNMSYCDLSGVKFPRSLVYDVKLISSKIEGANLEPFRNDVFAILANAPNEAKAVLDALNRGNVDGSTYSGDCCCLIGTISEERGCEYNEIKGVSPDSRRPAESFFAGIKEGDTPKDNEFSRVAAQWVSEFIDGINNK